jgi:hypothetical protein
MALNNEDILQLIAILQRGLLEDDSTQPKSKVSKKTRTTNKITKKKNPNNFEKMPEFQMCKEDLEIDSKIKKPPPSARNRPFDFISAQCRVCGKKEQVAPSIVESMERYKCNKCATGAG